MQNFRKNLSRAWRPWTVLLIIIIALIIFIPAIGEYYLVKKDLLNIWSEQARLLSDIILRSGHNIIALDRDMQETSMETYKNAGRYIRQLDSLSYPNHMPVIRYAGTRMKSIVLFYDQSGQLFNRRISRGAERIASDVWRQIERHLIDENNEIKVLDSFQTGRHSLPLLIMKRANGRGYIAVVPRPGRMQQQMRTSRVEMWLDEISRTPSVLYVELKRGDELIAASGRIPEFPEKAADAGAQWQIYNLAEQSIFDYIQQSGDGLTARIGIDGDALSHLNRNLLQRLLFSSILLAVFGGLLVIFVFNRRNLTLLSQKFLRMQSYTGSILENMTEGIIVLNQSKAITISNRAATELLGLAAADYSGRLLADLDLPFDQDLLGRLTSFETLSDQHFHFVRQGSDCHLLINAAPVQYAKDEDAEAGFLYIILLKDHTSQVQLEETRNRKSKLLAMGQLASRVAHEIRNPLNGIGVLAQRLQREFSPPDEQREYRQMTQSIRQESDRINTIIENFLAYARTPELKLQQVDLGNFITELKPILSSIAAVEYDLQPDCSAAIDHDQFTQVIENLVKNAAEASDKKSPVYLSLEKKDKTIQITVADRGQGIGADIKDKIFDLYYSTKEKGSGLGLSIVEKIVSAHRGQVFVESPYVRKGASVQGARFTIELPADAGEGKKSGTQQI